MRHYPTSEIGAAPFSGQDTENTLKSAISHVIFDDLIMYFDQGNG